MDRRGLDGRTAALYAAALAASWLALRAPQRVPTLTPGLGGPPPVPAPAAGEAPAWSGGSEPEELGREAESETDAEEDASDPEVRDSVAEPAVRAPGAADPRSSGSTRAGTVPEHRSDAATSGAAGRLPASRAKKTGSERAGAAASPSPRAARTGSSSRESAPAKAAASEGRRGAPPPRAHRETSSTISKSSVFRGQDAVPSRYVPRRSPSGRSGSRGGGTARTSLFSVPSAGRRPSGRTLARRAAGSRRFRPLLLSKLLGPRPLKPPPAGLKPPKELAALDRLRPSADARGAPVPAAAAAPSAVESLDPAKLGRDRRAAAHWDADQWHAGAARGVIRDGAWAWLYRDGARWWAVAKGAEPLVRHDGVWWTRERGTWYVLHDGEPWAQRPFHDWDGHGLFQPGSGTEMVYSKDYKRVAVIAPGAGAEVFDAVSGALLDRIPEAEMPPRRRPRAPSSLTLPN